jgi:hypothetical protein
MIKHDYFHKDIGYNYRMPNGTAKLALESLKNYPKENKRRRALEKECYGKNILDAVWVLYRIEGYTYNTKGLVGHQTRPFFKPLSSMPMWGSKCQSPKALYYSNGHYIKL